MKIKTLEELIEFLELNQQKDEIYAVVIPYLYELLSRRIEAKDNHIEEVEDNVPINELEIAKVPEHPEKFIGRIGSYDEKASKEVAKKIAELSNYGKRIKNE